MITPKDQISTVQAVALVTNFILGAGILSLPRTSIEKAETPDGWITVIVGGVISMIIGVIIVKLSQRYPGKTIYQYSQEIIGKWLGSLLNLAVIGYFIIDAGHEMRWMGEVTNLFLLEGTPTWAVIMSLMWIGTYLLLGGINPIARLFEIILPITVILFFTIVFMALKVFELDNLRPVLGMGIQPIIKNVKGTAFSYTGLEIMLIATAFMKERNQAVKAVLAGIFIPMVVYVITVVMTLGTLSVAGVMSRTLPTIDLMRSFEFQGVFFERYESLLLVIWIMQMFATCFISYYAAAIGLAQLCNKSTHPFIYGLLPVVYIISMMPKSIDDMFTLGEMVGNSNFMLFGISPILLLIVSKIRGSQT